MLKDQRGEATLEWSTLLVGTLVLASAVGFIGHAEIVHISGGDDMSSGTASARAHSVTATSFLVAPSASGEDDETEGAALAPCLHYYKGCEDYAIFGRRLPFTGIVHCGAADFIDGWTSNTEVQFVGDMFGTTDAEVARRLANAQAQAGIPLNILPALLAGIAVDYWRENGEAILAAAPGVLADLPRMILDAPKAYADEVMASTHAWMTVVVHPNDPSKWEWSASQRFVANMLTEPFTTAHSMWLGTQENAAHIRDAARRGDWKAVGAYAKNIAAGVPEGLDVASGILDVVLPIAGVSKLAATRSANTLKYLSRRLPHGARVALDGVEATAEAAVEHVDDIARAARKPQGVLAGRCFTAGTKVHTRSGLIAIENIEPGQRVLASRGPVDRATEVDSGWRRIALAMEDPHSADGMLHLTLLRPMAWVEASNARVGSMVDVSLSEMGIRGNARVLSLTHAGHIDAGAGSIVLATIQSQSANVLVLKFVGSDETLEPTFGHRLYSLDRDDWVRAGELRVGERLQSIEGAVTIASIERKAGVHAVYNLEVEGEHRYFVSRSAVLTHNDEIQSCAMPDPWLNLSRERPAVAPDIWSDTVREKTIDVFKERLGDVIDASGLNVVRFAREVGYDHSVIYRHLLPYRRRLPLAETLFRVAQSQNVSIDWMLGLETRGSMLRLWQDGTPAQLAGQALLPEELRARAIAAFKPRFTALAMRSDLTNRALAERIGRIRETVGTHVRQNIDAMPSVETLVVLAKQEGVRIDWLLGLIDEAPADVTPALLEKAAQHVVELPRRPRITGIETRSREARADIAPTVVQRIMSLIAESNSSQTQFARRAGISEAAIRMLSRKSDRLPRANMLIAIARSENVSVDWMLGLVEDRASLETTRARRIAASETPSVDLFKTRLAELVARSELSQRNYARRIGVDEGTIVSYLSARKAMLPSAETLVAIAHAENVRVDWLLGLID